MFETPHETYSFGEFTLDVSSHQLFRGQKEISLTAQPFKALVYLARNPNKLITKNDLIDAVRGKDADLTPDAPKKWIDQIRSKFGDQDQMIEIVRGEGWRFIPDTRLSPRETEKESTPTRRGAEGAGMPVNDGTETFERWMGGQGLLVLLTLVGGVTATIVISFAVAKLWGDSKAAMQAASGAQCLVILIALLHTCRWSEARGFRPNTECSEAAIIRAGFRNREDFQNDKADLENDLKQYTKYWRLLLLSWVPLYIVFALGDLGGPTLKILQVLFNLLNTCMLLGCFNALNKTVDDQAKEHVTGSVLNAVVLIILVGVLISLLITGDFSGATLLTGITAGVAMALYVGRLQSRFLGPRFWILYLLYSYTAIQPLVLYLDIHPEWGWKILDFALLLKCLLYLYVTWLFQSGLLLFYFARVKRTDTALLDQRKGFRELLE